MTYIKQELRLRLIEERKNMRPEERTLKNQQLTKKFIELMKAMEPFSTVHMFESIDSLGEVDTRPLVDYLKQTWPDLHIHHPKKTVNGWQNFDERGNLAVGVQYDLIIVPTLAFDNQLNRLGHGSGYYDKFLITQQSAYTIGLCFELGHVKQLPVEPHDVPLRTIISDKQVYKKSSL